MLFSVVMITFARDHIAPKAIEQIAARARNRDDIEFILVDNNPDAIDRTAWLDGFAHRIVLKLGRNKGVAARNDGALAAKGEFIVFVDDDAFLNPAAAFERYEDAFRGQPKLGIVTAQHKDAATGLTPNASFPHTDKSLARDRSLKTFRFQGNGFCMRREAFTDVGPMSEDFFYGMEEIDYAYRVIDRGWEILYTPEVWVVEHNDSGGRLPTRRVQEMRLTNKLIITYKYMPAAYVPLNMLLFSAYVFTLNRGRLNLLTAYRDFFRWIFSEKRKRTVIGPRSIAYIRECGGTIWK